jgi:cytochrome c556
MPRSQHLLLLATVVILGIACDGRADRADHDRADSTHAAASGDSAHAMAGESEHAQLTLRPIMVQLGTAMRAFTDALWLEDYPAMAGSAEEIADHPHISPEELERIQRILGDGMAAFETIDREVHESAVRLHEAARARQLDSIVARLAEVQRGCVACHERFRERLRTDPESGR